MNNHFQKNLRFLKKYYPGLIDAVVQDAVIPERKIKSMETRNNEPTATLLIGEQEYLLHSKYNAVAEAQKWLITIREKIESVENVVLFGLGLGYFLEALLDMPTVTQLIILEPSKEVFNELIRVRDISTFLLNRKVKFVAIGSEELLMTQLAQGFTSSLALTNLEFVSSPVYERMFGEVYTKFAMQVKNLLAEQISDYATLETFQNVWLNNILENLPYTILCPSLEALQDKWKGSKAIIVGSGPSLKEDVQYLKLLKGKCLIIAAGSSIQALQHHGLHPDLVVSIDGGDSNLRVFENVDTSQSPLLFAPQIHYGILKLYKKKMMHVIFQFDLISRYFIGNRPVPQFLSTSTVTGTAIQAAKYVGAEEIILMGQDLSYPEKKFYTSGVNHIQDAVIEKTMQHAEEKGIKVENVNGGLNMTTPKMLATLRDLEMLIKLESLHGIKFTNTSKMGAVIAGTEFKTMDTLKENLLTLKDNHFEIADLIVFPAKEKQLAYFEQTEAKLNFIARQCVVVTRKLDSLLDQLELMNQYRIQNKKSRLNETLIKIDALWEWISNKDIFSVFFSFSRGHYVKVYKKYVPLIVETTDLFEKAKLIDEHLRKLVMHLQQFIPELKKMLEDTIEKLSIVDANIRGDDDNGRLV